MILDLFGLESISIDGRVYTKLGHTWGSGHVQVVCDAGTMFHPSAPDAPSQKLVIDGPVYVRGASVHATVANGAHVVAGYTAGGYLGTVTNQYSISRYVRDRDEYGAAEETYHVDWSQSVTFQALAIIPSPYAGGVIVDGLSLPSEGDVRTISGRSVPGYWTDPLGTLADVRDSPGAFCFTPRGTRPRTFFCAHCEARDHYVGNPTTTVHRVYNGHANWIGTWTAWEFKITN